MLIEITVSIGFIYLHPRHLLYGLLRGKTWLHCRMGVSFFRPLLSNETGKNDYYDSTRRDPQNLTLRLKGAHCRQLG